MDLHCEADGLWRVMENGCVLKSGTRAEIEDFLDWQENVRATAVAERPERSVRHHPARQLLAR